MGCYLGIPDVSVPQCFVLIVPELDAGRRRNFIQNWGGLREDILPWYAGTCMPHAIQFRRTRLASRSSSKPLVVAFPSRRVLSFITFTPRSYSSKLYRKLTKR